MFQDFVKAGLTSSAEEPASETVPTSILDEYMVGRTSHHGGSCLC